MLIAKVINYEETRELEKEYDNCGQVVNMKPKENSEKVFLTLEFSNHSAVRVEIPKEFYNKNIIPLLTNSSPIQTSLHEEY